jgi:hypothetical protein
MATRITSILGLAVLAGCAQPDTDWQGPFTWSTTYGQPFEAMTYCLSANSTNYVAITGVDGRQGIGTVTLSFKHNNSPAGQFSVQRLGEKSSEVTFTSSVRTLGGGSYLDRHAREAADNCAR